ncbi:MAG: hypothetical protein PHI72_06840 [Atribacterota bacterium]|jgi:hypothetical protein|nr:hypothetical protein [Atribacterota bacterium]MDD4895370.1 hypothetical protein [Atribacterota bacterium]MDD5637413.1 hypothetical protein [Atribacterota bacterium]
MKIKNLLRSTVTILVIALIIGSLTVIALAKNGPGNGGMSGGGAKQGNQVQIHEPKKNQNRVQEPGNAPTKLQEQKKTQLQECEKECNQNCEENCNCECIGDGNGVQLQINAAELQELTIAQIAVRWDLDADNLLTKLIQTFKLEEEYTTKNTLNDLRTEYRFSLSEIKDILKALI